VLVLLFGAPLAFGSVVPVGYVPLLIIAITTGSISWGLAVYARRYGDEVSRVPGRRLLLGLHLVVLLQLLPLPAPVLRTVSPGSYRFHTTTPGSADARWMTITCNPQGTARGLVFLFGMTLLYGTVFREFREHTWRRRLAWTVVLSGTVATVVGLVQAGSPNPGRLYGIWQLKYDRWVFGPYANRSHYGGSMALVIPLAAALTAEAGRRLVRAWPRRLLLVVGTPAANAFLIRLSLTVLLVVGVFVPDSRSGMVGAAVGLFAFALVAGRRNVRAGLAVILVLGGLSAFWVDWDRVLEIFVGRGPGSDRIGLWRDQSRLIPEFALFGVGMNALGAVYPRYQTFERYAAWPQTHNEYLQALTDTGIVGAALVYALLVLLFRGAWRASRGSIFSAGVFASLLASATTTLVDFNWQIPATCATFVCLAGLAMAAGLDLDRPEGAS